MHEQNDDEARLELRPNRFLADKWITRPKNIENFT